jgi:uncharacterized protein (DUF1684 family)
MILSLGGPLRVLSAFALPIAAAALLAPLAPAQLTASSAPSAPSASPAETAWLKQINASRDQRARELSAPDGWLSLVALDWLKPGVNSLGAATDNSIRIANAPDHLGIITVAGSIIQLLSPHSGFPPDLLIDGSTAREGPLDVKGANPSTLAWHSLAMVVLPRGDRYALRVKDANAPTRTGFKGLHWYAPDLHYTVEARWIPSNPPHTVRIPTVIGTTLDLVSPGVAEFTLDGKTLRLEPVLEDPHATTLFFVLRDATSQTTTYQSARFLHTVFPDHGLVQPGTLILDFNQLYNPPCAYTPYATCPLPPDQNRLPIAIEAGEQRYTP